MSHEPPRVHFPGANIPPVNPLPPSQGRRPSGNAGRVVAIVLGVLFTFIFLCAGGAFITYRRFNADSNFGGSFKDLREPIGSALPDKTRDTIQNASASDAAEAEEVTNWIENEFPEVDKPRMVMEMQRSGLSQASINPLTRSIWALNLDQSLESPNLGEQVVVLSFEWLVENKEARVVVAGFSTYGDETNVYVLYLTRHEEKWKLFDWRDVLLPMSEAQFWAVYAGLDESQDHAYFEFRDAAYEIYNSPAATTEKINNTLTSYRQYKFPRRHKAMAQDLLCRWLVTYKAKTALAETVKQLNTDDFAGAWLYKAQSAAWSNESELAFKYLGELHKKVGWHPKTARIAGESARTPAQKQVASEWLQRALALAPVNQSNINSYFSLADRDQMESLFQQIAKNDRPSVHVLQLINSIGFQQERKIKLLSELLAPYPELQEARQFLDFKLAVGRGDDNNEVVNLAPKILTLDCLSDAEEQWNTAHEVRQDYLHAAIKSNSLERAAELAPNRDEFLTQLLYLATYEFDDLPPAETSALLKSIPPNHELRKDFQPEFTIARLDVKQGKADEAFDSLLTLYKGKESEIDYEEPHEFVYPLLKALGPAALTSGRWRELIGLLDSEVLFLTLAYSDDIEPKQLKQVLEWYEGVSNQPAHWAKYFRSRLAFESGDWPTADRSIAVALQSLKQESSKTSEKLVPLVTMLADSEAELGYETEIAYGWNWERMSYAARCNTLDLFFANAQKTDQLDDQLLSWLYEHVYSTVSLESQEKIASILKASPLAQAQKLSDEIRTELLLVRGQFAEAYDARLQRLPGLTTSSYEHGEAVRSAGALLLKIGDKNRIEPLRQAAQGTDEATYIDCIAATVSKNIPALSKTLSDDVNDSPLDRFIDRDVLNCLQGAQDLRDLTNVQPVDFSSLRFACAECPIALAADAADAAITFENFLKTKAINYRQIEASRFDQATSVFEVKTSDGELVLSFISSSEDQFDKNPQITPIANKSRALVRCALKDAGMQEQKAAAISLRSAVNGLMDGFPSALALGDVVGSSVFYGEGWQQRFSQSLETGIDLAHPKETYEFLKWNNAARFIERDGQSFLVLGEVRELVPIKLQPQQSLWSDERGLTLAPSILIPSLPADIFVTVDR